MRPFDPELNRAILRLAPAHEARDAVPVIDASGQPDALGALIRSPSGRLLVWAGASERTVYGDPAVNWAFRAWHDALHLGLRLPFDSRGEHALALEHAAVMGRRSDAWARVMLAEVYGQVRHVQLHGAFPSDQAAFTVAVATGKLEGYL